MVKIMLSYTTITTTLACFQRIQSYLLLPELEDRRETISDLVLRARGDDEGGTLEKRAVVPANKPCIEFKLPQPPVVFLDASIAPASGKEPILKQVSFSITRFELAVVLGQENRHYCGQYWGKQPWLVGLCMLSSVILRIATKVRGFEM